MNRKLVLIFMVLLFHSCKTISPGGETSNSKDVLVLGINDKVPEKAQYIDEISIGYFPPYLSLYEKYDSIIKSAREETAKIGGNIFKIKTHTPYQYNVGNKSITYHKIKGDIYKLENFNDNILIEGNPHRQNPQARLHIYMFYQGGVSKDIYLNDILIYKGLKSKSKFIYETKNFGKNFLKCGKNGTPLQLDLEKGGNYYIKCNIKLGAIRNISFFEKKDSINGAKEFNFIK